MGPSQCRGSPVALVAGLRESPDRVVVVVGHGVVGVIPVHPGNRVAVIDPSAWRDTDSLFAQFIELGQGGEQVTGDQVFRYPFLFFRARLFLSLNLSRDLAVRAGFWWRCLRPFIVW